MNHEVGHGRRAARRARRVSGPFAALRAGFTLVELITVVAILGILTILMVGAVQGVRNKIARDATFAAFQAIDAALQSYYEDWGNMYPWIADGTVAGDQFGQADFAPTSPTFCRPAKGQSTDEDAAGTLYAALNLAARHGPYFRGSSPPVIQRRPSATKSYMVFADGWGRMIRYKKPSDPKKMPPILESDGPDEFSADEDKLRNYGESSYK
jgi:prepilin-type N-terminal cleavage/methylation domain-containing protein